MKRMAYNTYELPQWINVLTRICSGNSEPLYRIYIIDEVQDIVNV